MPEKMAGRLTWEGTGAGIRVEIPARRNWQAVGFAVLLCGWTVLSGILNASVLPGDNLSTFGWICFLAGIVGLCVVVPWVLWDFTGRAQLVLTASEMTIKRRVVGIEWDTRSFRTLDVRGLRYFAPREIWAFRTDTDPATSKIQFRAAGKTYVLARGITEREAASLVDRMKDVYDFPNDSLTN